MFSRLRKVAEVVYQYFSNKLGEYLANPAAILVADGLLSIQKIRKGFSTWNKVIVMTQNLTPAQSNQLIKQVMTLGEPEARSAYNLVNHLTSSNFFLSMEDAKARKLRDYLIRSLRVNVHDVAEELTAAMTTMLDYLRKQPKVTDEVRLHLDHEIRGLLTRVLTGLHLTPRMHALLDKNIEDQALGFGFAPAIPYYWRMLSAKFREYKSEYDLAIREFLQAEFRRLTLTDCSEDQLLLMLIRDKYPEKKLPLLLADPDVIQQLINDPDIRLCISGALASANLAPVIRCGMLYLHCATNMHAPRKTHRQLICEELTDLAQRDDILTDEVFFDRSQLPYLDAYWLEAIRCFPPMAGVVRVSCQGINAGEINIPEKSIIYMPIMSNAEIAGDKIDRDKFEPMRHINLPDNLHRGFFTPFGLGPRMCPATKIAGLIFKKFIAGMALNLDEFSVENIKFRSQQNLSLPIARQKYRKK